MWKIIPCSGFIFPILSNFPKWAKKYIKKFKKKKRKNPSVKIAIFIHSENILHINASALLHVLGSRLIAIVDDHANNFIECNSLFFVVASHARK